MKIVGIIALTLGLTMGAIGSAIAERGDADNAPGVTGTAGECWMEKGRGGAYEVCGTVFSSHTQADDSPRGE